MKKIFRLKLLSIHSLRLLAFGLQVYMHPERFFTQPDTLDDSTEGPDTWPLILYSQHEKRRM